ncbi:MAG: hypothetical protein OMM_01434 [Candidatus Magnetoglobus multicellularis str. Araruama]|uniref:Uncharacterized protein n=1 Tax=Candidatus Magnetoglobus multicellularis str. Araruama TaxID=890399 RepID=A0A1V1PCZ8_9BACT|nr:MAG: hypothetical protein OMM_01434 [Candidatus Magnetoglobus multicellularis str. Araruama]
MGLHPKNIVIYIISIFLMISMVSIAWGRMDIVSDSELSSTYGRGMNMMTDQELSDVNGQAGFTKFTLNKTNDKYQARADIDLELHLWAHIDVIKMGYYDFQGQTGVDMSQFSFLGFGWEAGLGNGYNWDIDWGGLDFGTESSPLILNGLVIRLDYQEINGNKVLNRFIFGSDRVKGNFRADDLFSFTGKMNTKLAPGSLASWLNLDLWANRTNILNGPSGILGVVGDVADQGMVFNNNGFYVVFDKELGVGAWAGFPINDIED